MSPLFIVEALGFGALIGLSLGALGAGGSILTVPVLVYVMGVPVQSAAATSLAIVGLNAAAGALEHLRRGRSLPRTGIAFGLSGLLGALAGAWLNHLVRAEVVLVLFALLMLGAAWSLVRRRVSADPLTFSEHYSTTDWVRLGALGMAVGLLTGFFGVGGGFLIVPALVVVLGLPMRLAIGTSLLAIALNALWGVLGYLRFGDLDWGLTALFALAGLVGVMAGGKLAGRLPERALRSGFASVIVTTAVYTLVRSATALAIRT
jgi:uncharacterized membrane protein YfcA